MKKLKKMLSVKMSGNPQIPLKFQIADSSNESKHIKTSGVITVQGSRFG